MYVLKAPIKNRREKKELKEKLIEHKCFYDNYIVRRKYCYRNTIVKEEGNLNFFFL